MKMKVIPLPYLNLNIEKNMNINGKTKLNSLCVKWQIEAFSAREYVCWPDYPRALCVLSKFLQSQDLGGIWRNMWTWLMTEEEYMTRFSVAHFLSYKIIWSYICLNRIWVQILGGWKTIEHHHCVWFPVSYLWL